MTYELKDPVSGLTHMIGAALAIPGLVVLVYSAALYATTWHIVSFAIFGASLILLYTASTVYHSLSLSKRMTGILRRIDHMMIYILIAGSYTPICLVPFRDYLRDSGLRYRHEDILDECAPLVIYSVLCGHGMAGCHCYSAPCAIYAGRGNCVASHWGSLLHCRRGDLCAQAS